MDINPSIKRMDSMMIESNIRQMGRVELLYTRLANLVHKLDKDDFTIDEYGVPVCPSRHRMRRDGVEVAKGWMKFKCPKISRKNDRISCTCETPCSDAKYGRTVHLVMKDNSRLFNNPPRSSNEWKLEYNARTSAEHSNKREKLDFKLEYGRHRSTKMWYCRLYHILMLQHLDA